MGTDIIPDGISLHMVISFEKLVIGFHIHFITFGDIGYGEIA